MNKFIYTLIAAALLWGCQHSIVEPIHAIPMVDVRIEPTTEQSGKNEAVPSVHRVYLYPQFDYAADPISFDATDNVAQVALLPGGYRAVLHSLPLGPLVLSGTESFETASVSLSADAAGDLPSCPMFYALREQDPMKSVGVTRAEEGDNLLVFSPILVTKRIKFELNTSKFGTITSVRGVLTGLASSFNLSTFKTEQGATTQFKDVIVEGNTLIIEAFGVLGFTAETLDDVVLTLFVSNEEVDFELEQPVDLTQDVKDLKEEGGDVEFKIDLVFNPDIRVHPVTIRQWDESGNEIEIGFK